MFLCMILRMLLQTFLCMYLSLIMRIFLYISGYISAYVFAYVSAHDSAYVSTNVSSYLSVKSKLMILIIPDFCPPKNQHIYTSQLHPAYPGRVSYGFYSSEFRVVVWVESQPKPNEKFRIKNTIKKLFRSLSSESAVKQGKADILSSKSALGQVKPTFLAPKVYRDRQGQYSQLRKCPRTFRQRRSQQVRLDNQFRNKNNSSKYFDF